MLVELFRMRIMRVEDLFAVRDGKINNYEKALLIAKMQRIRAKQSNPTDTDIPTGWNASPFPGSRTDSTGG
jgi:hypothetical protein